MIKVFVIMFVIGALLGAALMLANRFLAVREDKRQEEALKMLPGYNCGACGYPGCSGMIAALLNKETDTLQCTPSTPEQRQAIVDYLNSSESPDGEKLHVKSI
ncbi:MAG: electron transporter RnfB [Erysipelotrichaceae bacterium]|nr:electron transporter RnfB [Erysipelotrichaceae bacterium]